jgi:predicted nucleotidyltransferase
MHQEDILLAINFKQRLEAITEVKQMIVFGSRARGDSSPGSDLDVFIELPGLSHELRDKIFNIAWELSFENEIVISTLLATSKMLVNSPLAANPILRTIQAEGVAV